MHPVGCHCTDIVFKIADPSDRAVFKVWVCGCFLAGIVGSTFAGVWVSVVCCQVEVSATGRSLVQRSRTECGVSACVCVCVCVCVCMRERERLSVIR